MRDQVQPVGNMHCVEQNLMWWNDHAKRIELVEGRGSSFGGTEADASTMHEYAKILMKARLIL